MLRCSDVAAAIWLDSNPFAEVPQSRVSEGSHTVRPFEGGKPFASLALFVTHVRAGNRANTAAATSRANQLPWLCQIGGRRTPDSSAKSPLNPQRGISNGMSCR